MATRTAKPQAFTYVIDLDERGEFKAHVSNSRGKSVYEIDALFDAGVFEDGWMRHGNDVAGLAKYMRHLGIMRPADTLSA